MLALKIFILACVLGSSLARDVKVSQYASLEEEDLNDFYDGCGAGKFCLGAVPDCEENQDCEFFVGISINSNESTATFQMTRKGLGYVAVGLSHDDKMGEDNVVACVQSSKNSSPTSTMWSIYTIAQGKIDIAKKAEFNKDLSNLGFSFIDDMILCQFDIALNSTRQQHFYDLTLKSGQLQILLVMGNANTASNYKTVPILHHDKHVNRQFLLPGSSDTDTPPISGSAMLQQGFFAALLASSATLHFVM